MNENLSNNTNNAKFTELDARGMRSLQRVVPNPADLCAKGLSGSPKMLKKYSALTGSLMGELPATTATDVPEVFARARAAGKEWEAMGFKQRKCYVRKFVDEFLAERTAILDIVQWENGKSRGAAYEEYYDVLANCGYYSKRAERILRPKAVPGAVPVLTKVEVQHHAKGVVGIITPWNYPLNLAISDAVAAMMAGNSIVLKPDSLTPFSALVIKSLLNRAGVPEDVFQVIVGAGRELGDPMSAHADYMMFTGSSDTGRTIAQQAGKNLIDFSCELGGKNALIVRADAPVKRAARGVAKACFSASGQLCISIERIYIHEDVWDEFVPELVKVTNDIKVDASMSWSVDMGPLISDAQIEKVQQHVSDAVAKGAQVLSGGKLLPEVAKRAFRPTILVGVTPEMDVYAEETFGPVVSLYKVSSDEEALKRANDTNYGLNGAIWSANLREAKQIASKMQSGSVNINDGYSAAWGSMGAPNGGIKDSGLAHRHGAEGILKYTDARTVATQRLMHIAAPKWMGEKAWATGLNTWMTIQHKLHL